VGGGAILYSLELSHPAHAARLMLELKGVEHRVVDLLPGPHPLLVRARRFPRGTVPALRIDGRRVQGSREISRFLDEWVPEPVLLPSSEVVEAERWGEEVLQPIPRRAFRWGTSRDRALREWVARDAGLPAPGLVARSAFAPKQLARISAASDENVRRDLAALPAHLDHVDSLIASGVIGGEQANAADFQIGCTVRVLLAKADLRAAIEGRPCAELAMRVLPDYAGPIPPYLPREWLP
jgi:glutathione S-transferase